MGSASSLPDGVPSIAASASAATTAIKGHTHHDQPQLARFDTPMKGCLLVILSLLILASFQCIPVYPHMMLVTAATIYLGSRFSLKCWKIESGSSTATNVDSTGKEVHRAAGEQMQTKDAMMFPVIGSCVLFSLYCVYKFLPAYWVNIVIKLYFFLFGCLVLAQKLSQILTGVLPVAQAHKLLGIEMPCPNPLFLFQKIETALLPILKLIPKLGYNEPLKEGEVVPPPSELWMTLSLLDFIALGIALVVSAVYITTGSWVCSNLFGIAFSIQGIEMLSLGSYLNGCILLCGLFIYDIFWVFGTDVMVTVAKSFDAPIKLLFPQFMGVDSNPSMLGLGDIVIPGIFIALLLRYDIWRQIQRIRKSSKKTLSSAEEHNLECLYCHVATYSSTLSPIYFFSNLFAYFVGLSVTVGVMYYFKAAQPALLYLVPACLGTSLIQAIVRGDMKTLWKYTENEEQDTKKVDAPAESTSTTKKVAAVTESTDDGDESSAAASEPAASTQRVTRPSSSKKKRSARAD